MGPEHSAQPPQPTPGPGLCPDLSLCPRQNAGQISRWGTVVPWGQSPQGPVCVLQTPHKQSQRELCQKGPHDLQQGFPSPILGTAPIPGHSPLDDDARHWKELPVVQFCHRSAACSPFTSHCCGTEGQTQPVSRARGGAATLLASPSAICVPQCQPCPFSSSRVPQLQL